MQQALQGGGLILQTGALPGMVAMNISIIHHRSLAARFISAFLAGKQPLTEGDSRDQRYQEGMMICAKNISGERSI
jgi:hypothetical protein